MTRVGVGSTVVWEVNRSHRHSRSVLCWPTTRRLCPPGRRLFGLVPGVEIVSEAADGSEAVELVHSLAPEIVLLDSEMPNLDGPAAAEVILSRRPQTRIVLHSGGASEQKRAQAAALGLTILDKSLLGDTVRLIEAVAAQMRPTVEPLVLLALADHGGHGVLIVGADETIPFYNGIAASMLHLPVPAQRLSLSTLRERVRVIDEHGLPRGIEELPLSRALSARVATHASVTCEYVVDGSEARFEMASLPFFSPDGEFIGVGNYLSTALPEPPPASTPARPISPIGPVARDSVMPHGPSETPARRPTAPLLLKPFEVQAGVHRPIAALDLAAVFFQRLLELGMLVTDHDRAHVRIGELLERQIERGKHIRIGDEAPSIVLTTSIRSPRHVGNCVARGRQNFSPRREAPVIASHEAPASSPSQERRLWRRHGLGPDTAKGRLAGPLCRGSSDDLPSCSIFLVGVGARIRSPRCFQRGKQRKRRRFDGVERRSNPAWS